MTKITLSIIFAIILSIFATQCLFAGSLVAYWSFDEGSGKVLKDQSGTGNDGQVNGAKWVDGKFSKAMKFNGVDEFVVVPNNEGMFHFSQKITLHFVKDFFNAKSQRRKDARNFVFLCVLAP